MDDSDPLHLRDWAILVAAAGAFIVGLMTAAVPIITALGKIRMDLKTIKTQTDGMQKILAEQAKQIGIEEGKKEGAAAEIETGGAAFAAGQAVEKAKNGNGANGT